MIPLVLLVVVTALLLKSRVAGEDAVQYPVPRAEDWKGWVWPVPIWNGRTPVISDGFSRTKTAEHRKHLGVDIMFRRVSSDPPGVPYSSPHFSSQNPPPPIVAAFDGTVWGAGLSGRGWQILIDHGKVGNLGGVTTWYQHLDHLAKPFKKGDKVRAGDILGVMGHDIDPQAYHLKHLHFQLAFPRPGLPGEQWLVDPTNYMAFWQKIPMPPQHLPTSEPPKVA